MRRRPAGPEATSYDATQLLWDAYDPWIIWPMLGTVGAISVLGMIYNYYKSREKTA